MRERDYTKLGGWLLFFVITSCISIIRNMFALSSLSIPVFMDWNGREISTLAVLIVLISVVSVAGAVAAQSVNINNIVKRRPSERIRAVLLIQAGINLVTGIVAYLLLYIEAGSLASYAGDVFLSFSGILIYTAIWYTYFKRSVRVAVYTGEAGSDDDAAPRDTIDSL